VVVVVSSSDEVVKSFDCEECAEDIKIRGKFKQHALTSWTSSSTSGTRSQIPMSVSPIRRALLTDNILVVDIAWYT
jgi:hypothetical protein